jgi:hypothetical protein
MATMKHFAGFWALSSRKQHGIEEDVRFSHTYKQMLLVDA